MSVEFRSTESEGQARGACEKSERPFPRWSCARGFWKRMEDTSVEVRHQPTPSCDLRLPRDEAVVDDGHHRPSSSATPYGSPRTSPVEEPYSHDASRGGPPWPMHSSTKLASDDLPEAVASDEVKVRVCGYLLDAPPAPSGDAFASAWRNSGAASLISRWQPRRAGRWD